MPMAPVVIAALIGAAATATTTGLQLSGAFTPERPKQTAPNATGPTTDQAKAAITPQAMTIESMTGGSVSPDYLSTIAPIVAGVGGQPNTPNAMQQVLQEIFGKGSTPSGTSSSSGMPSMPGMTGTPPFTPTGTTPNIGALSQTPGLSDFLQKMIGGLT